MYRPAAHAVDEVAVAIAMLRDHGFGHLVVVGRDGLDSVPLPVLIDDAGERVRAHVARANPIWRDMPTAGLLVVSPDDAYVSPSWYPSKETEPRVVPTWNYEVVHVKGIVRARQDPEWLSVLVRDLTDHHESALPAPWSVDDAPSDHIERMLRGIVGIELAVESIEAKRKLSQNRSADDVSGVVSGLSARDDRSRAVAAAMRRTPTSR
ncbi:MAG: FMN-binding negative transcriptional regulator [Acidimicrobiia bacterium]